MAYSVPFFTVATGSSGTATTYHMSPEKRRSLIDTRFSGCNDNDKHCYLHLACREGDDEMVKALLSTDPKPNINKGALFYRNFTPLHFACLHYKVVRTMMTTDPIPDVHKTDNTGRPASFYALEWTSWITKKASSTSSFLLMDSRPSLE